MPSIFLRFESWTVRVTSAVPDDLAWLGEFLACGFEPAPGPGHDAAVQLEVDAGAYHRALGEGPVAGEPVEGFARDSRPALLLPWRPPGTFHAPRLPGFYRVSPDGRAVAVLVPERTARGRLALMRVVRELAMDRVVATEGILMHAAAVAYDAGVVVIAGPKGHGKTTLMLSLLATTGARYVCNDRCVIRPAGAGATARGLPTLVSIRSDGFRAFPALRERLLAVRADRPPAAPGAGKPGASLAPPEVIRLLGCETGPGGVIAALLFPRVLPGVTGLALTRLPAREALARFRSGLFRADHPSVLGAVFASPAARTRGAWEAAAGAARTVTGRVPCFDCALPAGAGPEPGECADLVARALAR